MAERGEYRSISRSLFSGKDFRKLPERPRWIFTVLKMNSGMVGLDTWYEAELHSRLAEESGATVDQVKLALDYLEHENWIRREDNVLWVVGHLEHDPHLNASNANHRKSVQRHVAGLPRLAIVKAFVKAHEEWFPKDEAKTMGIGWVFDGYRMPSGRAKRTPKTHPPTHSDHDNEDETENEKDTDTKPPASGEAEISPSGGWPAEASEFWTERVSPITPPRCGAALKSVVDRFGWPRTKAGIEKYIVGTPEGRVRDLTYFAKEANKWVRFGGMKTTDEKGDFTEWGAYLNDMSRKRTA